MSDTVLKQQYELVKSSRHVLLNFCKQLKADEFVAELPNFGRGSIRNLLTHTANTYVHWLQKFALRNDTPYFDPLVINRINDVENIYNKADQYTEAFLHHFENNMFDCITSNVPHNGKTLSLTPLTLFTHVITHEFHHKGQIMSMCRQFGYIPVDTDAIRS